MIVQLRGQLVHKDATQAVVDCGGVGYGLAMSLHSLGRIGEAGADVTLFVHTHLSQDALRLYGFADAAERTVFESLLGATGVGPRLALAILSTLSPKELASAVVHGDTAALRRIPGVGPKKAERLLVELRDRLPETDGEPLAPGRGGLLEDLTSALTNLGFNPQTATRTARDTLDGAAGETDLATLVRQALRASTST